MRLIKLFALRPLGVVIIAAGSLSSALAQPVRPPLVLPPAPAGVEITTEHGIEFATVNLQNNPAYRPNGYDGPPFVTQPYGNGNVTEAFRIARVELTARQFEPFTRAFVRSAGGPILSNHDGMFDYFAEGPSPRARFGYENYPIPLAAEQALRLCNWLHNGAPEAPTTMDAFDTGAYDLRNIPRAANGALLTLRLTKLPGARFFLPDYDQWLAATFYDPNRFGNGQGGYWEYPNRSDTMPVPTAGDLSTGTFYFNDDDDDGIPVAYFPNQQSPWGLLDTVGGNGEYVGGPFPTFNPDIVRAVGFGSEIGQGFDSRPLLSSLFYNEVYQTDSGGYSATGLRIATVIPTPASGLVAFAFGLVLRRKR